MVLRYLFCRCASGSEDRALDMLGYQWLDENDAFLFYELKVRGFLM